MINVNYQTKYINDIIKQKNEIKQQQQVNISKNQNEGITRLTEIMKSNDIVKQINN
jgi:hypothetical protein